jgi:hypothetical protein
MVTTYACFVTSDPSKLGGPAPFTSWLQYSRRWSPTEKAYVDEMISKIKSDYPHATGYTPFASLSTLLGSFDKDMTNLILNKQTI